MLQLGDPGVVGVVDGVPFVLHCLSDHADPVRKLDGQERDMGLYEEVEIVVLPATVTTDGGQETGQHVLLGSDLGYQCPG